MLTNLQKHGNERLPGYKTMHNLIMGQNSSTEVYLVTFCTFKKIQLSGYVSQNKLRTPILYLKVTYSDTGESVFKNIQAAVEISFNFFNLDCVLLKTT